MRTGRFYVIWFDRRLDPANVKINTWQAVSKNDAASFSSDKISSRDWDPNCGFFTSGAFIGDYNGLAASTDAVYAVWTDGRNNAIGETGIGETDIFTSVQKNPSRHSANSRGPGAAHARATMFRGPEDRPISPITTSYGRPRVSVRGNRRGES